MSHSTNPDKFCKNCKTLLKIIDNTENNIQTGGNKYLDIINNILSDTIDNSILNNLSNIKDIFKSSQYQSLKLEQQEIVFNKIQELLPKEDKQLFVKKQVKESSSKKYYLFCNDCMYSDELMPNTLIFSEKKDKKHSNIMDFSNRIHDPILPRTSDYVCINERCDTHQKGGLAVYLRYNEKIVYICETCKYQWS